MKLFNRNALSGVKFPLSIVIGPTFIEQHDPFDTSTRRELFCNWCEESLGYVGGGGMFMKKCLNWDERHDRLQKELEKGENID